MLEKLKAKKNGMPLKIIVFLGIAGMALILFSDMLFTDKEEKSPEKEQEQQITGEYSEYTADMEKKLESILESIDGVGKSKVMITAKGTEEYVYAEEGRTDTDSDSISRDSKYVIVGSGNRKEALLKKVVNPEISGVIIVCEGGDRNVVREQVYKTVSAAFDIPAGRISVSKLME